MIEAYVYKIIEQKDYFLLITDNSQMEVICESNNRNILLWEGFIVNTPQEYKAQRTILLRSVDPYLNEFNEQELKEMIMDNANK